MTNGMEPAPGRRGNERWSSGDPQIPEREDNRTRKMHVSLTEKGIEGGSSKRKKTWRDVGSWGKGAITLLIG